MRSYLLEKGHVEEAALLVPLAHRVRTKRTDEEAGDFVESGCSFRKRGSAPKGRQSRSRIVKQLLWSFQATSCPGTAPQRIHTVRSRDSFHGFEQHDAGPSRDFAGRGDSGVVDVDGPQKARPG